MSGYPRYRKARAHKHFIRTTGDLSLGTGTSWADLPTIGTSWDAVLAAEVGDTLECSIQAALDSAAVNTFFDCFTIVSSAPVSALSGASSVSNANDGAPAWFLPASAAGKAGGSLLYDVQSVDLVGGLVTVRLRYRQDSATSRNLHATDVLPLHFAIKNLGPPDPH